MNLALYSVKDNVAGVFLPPVTFPSRAVALRAFSTAVNSGDKNSLLSAYPKDASIYFVGIFDDKTGFIEPKCDFIVNCVDLLQENTANV